MHLSRGKALVVGFGHTCFCEQHAHQPRNICRAHTQARVYLPDKGQWVKPIVLELLYGCDEQTKKVREATEPQRIACVLLCPVSRVH